MTDIAVIIPPETALQVFTKVGGVDPYLDQLKAEKEAFIKEADISSFEGREKIKSFAYKLAKFKNRLDEVGKELSAEMKLAPKKIDAERSRVWDILEEWQKEVRKPLTEWEQKEESRVAGLNARIQAIEAIQPLADDSSAAIEGKLADVNAVPIGDDWQEFKVKASTIKAAAVQKLTEALVAARQREADAAELKRLRDEAAARLRRENEERIAREAAEKAKREAEEAATAALEAERKAAEDARIVAEAQAQAERDAAAKALQDAENARLAIEAKAKADLEAEQARAAQEKAAAERKAKADADAAAERERALKAAAEKAEQDRKDAEARASKAAADERSRIAKEQADKAAAEAAELAKREADKKHRAKINRAAMEAFIEGGFTEAQAKLAVELIAKKSIPSVTISY